MKRKDKLLSLIIVFFLIIFSTQMVNLSKANPLIFHPVTPPTINIFSPVKGQAYPSNDVWLNFTIYRPKDWISPLFNNSEVYSNIGQITIVAYGVDIPALNNGEKIEFQDPLNVVNPPSNLSFSVNLKGLSDGNHTVGVFTEGIVNATGIGISSPRIPFTVYTAPESMSFPIPLVLAPAAAVVVGVGLFAYFKKNKRSN